MGAPFGFEIPKAGRLREVRNPKGPHSGTFPCVKQRYIVLSF